MLNKTGLGKSKGFKSLCLLVTAEMLLLLASLAVWIVSGTGALLPLMVVSLMGLTGLVALCAFFLRMFFSKDTYKHVLWHTGLTWAIGYAGYVVIVLCREYEYVADFTMYYNVLEEYYALYELSPIKGFAGTLRSMWFSDYSYFICIFLALPVKLIGFSHDAFVLIYAVVFGIPVTLAFQMLVQKLSECVNKKKSLIYRLMGDVLYLLFPMLHSAEISGMPDIFGMTFVFMVMVLLEDYTLEKVDVPRNVMLGFLSLCLAVTRRWYLFWLVGIYAGYGVVSIAYSVIKKELKQVFRNGMILVGTIGAFMLVLLPTVYNIFVLRNFSQEYAAWYVGGLPYELWHQISYQGLLLAGLMLAGIVSGLISEKMRMRTAISILGFFVTIFLFTRIQNMNRHQTLCLVGFYMTWMLNLLQVTVEIKRRAIRYCLIMVILGTLIAANIYNFTMTEQPVSQIGVFSSFCHGATWEWK